ncbi:MAG: bacteriocin immunity protein [Gammaproteobacteria bacterium]
MNLKRTLQEYSESEFLEYLNEFFNNPNNLKDEEFEVYFDRLTEHFDTIVEHPEKSDLIYYPAPGIEDSPEGVISVIKTWLRENGKPGFREEP